MQGPRDDLERCNWRHLGGGYERLYNIVVKARKEVIEVLIDQACGVELCRGVDGTRGVQHGTAIGRTAC